MNKKCLGCGKEYDSKERYCPDCYSKNREINEIGKIIFSIALIILVVCFILNETTSLLINNSSSFNLYKILLIIGLILLVIGGTLRIEKRFNCTLVDKKNYNEKIKYKEFFIRILRYLILTIILGIIIYFIIKSMY